MNRQYVVITDEFNPNISYNSPFNKGYEIHELTSPKVHNDPPLRLSPDKLFSHLLHNKNYSMKKELHSSNIVFNLPLENGDASSVDNNFSKTTQTLHKNHDQAVNTTTDSICASTVSSLIIYNIWSS